MQGAVSHELTALVVQRPCQTQRQRLGTGHSALTVDQAGCVDAQAPFTVDHALAVIQLSFEFQLHKLLGEQFARAVVQVLSAQHQTLRVELALIAIKQLGERKVQGLPGQHTTRIAVIQGVPCNGQVGVGRQFATTVVDPID